MTCKLRVCWIVVTSPPGQSGRPRPTTDVLCSNVFPSSFLRPVRPFVTFVKYEQRHRRRTDGQTDRQTVDRRTNGRTDRQTDGRTDGRLNRFKNKQILMPIDTSGLRGNSVKQATFGVRRSKVKVTWCRNRPRSHKSWARYLKNRLSDEV